ncbi:glycosyltransferase [Aequorivita echinoideorum]|uniref:Glycosyltransferase n=1 Tax=Aequorivita echinoideorum TaxID=1549647 RepID=A0ABS5S409_9FLAO|nr:glycosyltransferase [Aequorivita echinoideorum]MBT0607929.1 glycosyltransferase [Aequorivita echinoideorum]
MKVLHVINSLAAAGAESLVVTLANEQTKEHTVSIFTFNSTNDFFSERLNSSVNYITFKNSHFFSIKKINSLLRLIEVNDIIHVHLFPAFYIVGFLSFLSKKRFVYTEHSTGNNRRNELYKPLERLIYSQYYNIICISNSVERNLKIWMNGNVATKVISNTINYNQISDSVPLSKENLSSKNDSKLLVMVGRFQLEKDQDTVIRAMKYLPKNYGLILIGVGERLPKVKQLVNSLLLEDRVKFLGLRTDVYSILKTCDYGILSSHWEGFGIAALEYMACGLPALGSNVEGLNEVIPIKENLFEVSDYSYLAERILKIENDVSIKKSIIIQQNEHLKNFNIETAVNLHNEVYLKAL